MCEAQSERERRPSPISSATLKRSQVLVPHAGGDRFRPRPGVGIFGHVIGTMCSRGRENMMGEKLAKRRVQTTATSSKTALTAKSDGG